MSWREWLGEIRSHPLIVDRDDPLNMDIEEFVAETNVLTAKVPTLIEGFRLMAEAVGDVENAAGASFGGFVLCPVCEFTYNCEHPGGHDSECRLGAALDFLRGVGRG